MFCGTGSFKRVDEDPWTPASAPGSPKGSKRKANKNPYSSRGLDKFSTVLTELEARKEKIMEKAGTQGVSMIRFMYSNSQDWIPIIVRLREDAKDERTKPADANKPTKQLVLPPSQPNSEIVEESDPPVGLTDAKEVAKEAEPIAERKMKKCLSWSLKEGVGAVSWRWRPSYYWPLVMVLMLVCLVMFGRVFAICCTSIWWYLVPTMKGGNGNARRSVKKDYGRRQSDKRLGGTLGLAPSFQAKKVVGVQEMSSPRAHGNGKRG